MNARNRSYRKRALTLIETLLTVAVLSSVIAGAVMFISSTTDTSAEVKLQNDVAAINKAIGVYRAGGGNLAGLSNPHLVLAKLKTRASNADEIAAINGSKLDYRLKAVMGSGELVAYWDKEALIFRLTAMENAPSGAETIAAFMLDAQATPVEETEDRTAMLKLAQDNWVWDYRDSNQPAQGPRARETFVNTVPEEPGLPSADKLYKPLFSTDPGQHPLAMFPLSLTITNPNLTGTSVLMGSRDSGAWSEVSGPLTVMPGEQVLSFAATVDASAYLDSDTISGIYTPQKVKLQAGDNFPSSVSYVELGGPLAHGSIAPAPREWRISLLNEEAIPDYWENHTTFQTFWTLDGSAPEQQSSGRIPGNNVFEKHYPGDALSPGVDLFSDGRLEVKYLTAAKNETVVISSDVISRQIVAAPLQLTPPVITPEDRLLTGMAPVVIDLNTSSGNMPEGARIYYRTDGSDPGVINGEPGTGATLYTGPFIPDPGFSPVVTIIARVYPPVDAKSWFITSSPASRRYYLPYGEKNIYAVRRSDRNIYAVDAQTGTSALVDSTAPFTPRAVALDAVAGHLYYVESASAGWRLGRLDIIHGTHVILGRLSEGLLYNASAQPDNLAYFNNSLYYLHSNSDDLVRITVSDTGITGAAKVADVSGNSESYVRVGDIAVDDTGWMFFADDTKRYFCYSLLTFSGLKQLGITERVYDALALYQSQLYGSDASSDRVRRISLASGATLSSVATVPVRQFSDYAAPALPAPLQAAQPVWAVIEKSDGPHLCRIRDYRNPVLAAEMDYGLLEYRDGTSVRPLGGTGGSGIHAMCLARDGILFFARNLDTTVGAATYRRALFKLNVSSIVIGDALHATVIGDMSAGLASMARTLDPDDHITGLALSPSGTLYGVLKEGADSGPGSEDYLFRLTQTTAALSGPDLGITTVGRTISAAGASTATSDLCFSPDGALYAADSASGGIYRLNPADGSVFSVHSMEPGGSYRAASVDPLDNRIVVCGSNAGEDGALLLVAGGAGNDQRLIHLPSLLGLAPAEALAFVQGPFTPAIEAPDIYAVDGTETIYGVDFDTGNTIAVTDAPYRVRALAFDFPRRTLYYLEDNNITLRAGSYNILTGIHTPRGVLNEDDFTFEARTVPDNFCYFGGYLWYVRRGTDDLIRLTLNNDGDLIEQHRVAHLTNNTLRFDLIGDLAVNEDGWMYFTAIRSDGQRFCRYRLSTLSSFQVISGPTLPSQVLTSSDYQEIWFDALAFRPPDANGTRPLYGTYASATTALRILDPDSGASVQDKPTVPAVRIIDFSEFHPGNINSPTVRHDLALGFTNLKNTYSYADVGGAFVAGTSPPPAPYSPPSLYLVNRNELALSLQNSSNFSVKWTYDGQSPKTGAAFAGPAFNGGMPVMALDISMERWAGRSTLPLRAMGVSLKPELFNDSPLLAADPAIERTGLRLPLITEIEDDPSVRKITIAADTDPGDSPPGTRIYYTLDGSDPGVVRDAFGVDQPATGTLYNGTIQVPAIAARDGQTLVHARVYPPADKGVWFDASELHYFQLPPGAKDFILGIHNLKAAYTYAEVGGPFLAGSSPAPAPYPAPYVYLANTDDIPLKLQNSSNYSIRWTYDGQSPKTSPAVSTGANFSNGMPSMYLPVNFDRWAGRTTLPLRAMAVSVNPQLFADSAVVAGETSIQKTQLRAPIITADLSDPEVRKITITPNINAGDCPPGTRIYYTTNDTDPGITTDAQGVQQPLTGTLYNGVIQITAIAARTSPVVITARVYPPAATGAWFNASTARDYDVPPGPDDFIIAFGGVKSAYSYADVGGPFEAGTTPPPAPAAAPYIYLTNKATIPAALQNSSNYNIRWTYDSTEPRTSATAINGPAFSGGMPNIAVPVNFSRWGSRTSLPLRARAVSLDKSVFNDSSAASASATIQKTQLRAPIIGEIIDDPLNRKIVITPDVNAGDSPVGTRLYYTTDGTDPGVRTDSNGVQQPVTGTLYSGIVTIRASAARGANLNIVARAYPPDASGAWFTASASSSYGIPTGLSGGHMDVDTSSKVYAFRKGSTDGHVHEYDKAYNVLGANFFNMLDGKLENIQDKVGQGQRFKIIVSNANLSPGGHLVINNTYNSTNPGTYTPVNVYDDRTLASLPTYTLNGTAGTTRLTSFGLYFPPSVIAAGGLLKTETAQVVGNVPGKFNETRNGALTIQVVAVNGNGSNGFTTNTAYSNGGVQGTATSGLLWEATFFWHEAPAYNK